MALPENSVTRRERYYSVISGQNSADILPDKPVTREEKYLDRIARNGGGGGGTSDYTGLLNKPQINGTELTGNKTASDLGLVPAETGKGLSTNDYTDAEKAKLEGLENYDDTDIKAVIPSTASSSNKLATASDASSRDITFTASSSDISLTDSADARVQDLKIYGMEDGVGASGLTVTATGKNILQFDENLQTAEKNGITFEPRSDGGIYVHGTISSGQATYVFARDTSPYNVIGFANWNHKILSASGVPNELSGKKFLTIIIGQRVNPWKTFVNSLGGLDAAIEFSDEDINSVKYMYLAVNPPLTIDAIIYPMVRSAEFTSDFEEYKTPHILPLTTALPLRRIMKTVDLGDFDWTYQTDKKSEPHGNTFNRFITTTQVADLFDPTRNSNQNIREDIDTWFDNYREEYCSCSSRYTASRSAGGFEPIVDKTFIITPQGTIYIIDNAYTDAAAFKAAVSGITLTYPSYCDEIDLAAGQAITRIDNDGETVLSEPVITPLSDAEIQAFREFRTFEGVTNITATDDPHMTVEYVKNTGNGRAVARVQDDAGKNIIKTLTYTGTGSTSQTITFPERPFMVIGFTQDSDPTYIDKYHRTMSPFVFSDMSAMLRIFWADKAAAASSQNYAMGNSYYLTLNGNSMSWTGLDASQALNQEGVKYTIYYI